MEQEKLKELFESIKKDDLKSFSFIMTSNTDLNISFGRFPILSLLYLYNSYKILKAYEKVLMAIHNYKREKEFFEIYKAFKRKAKKAIRLYQSDECFVYPVEMLSIVDNRFLLSKNYKYLFKNDEICSNIKKIYNLSGEYSISLDLQNIAINKKKFTFRQKVIGFCLAGVFILMSLLMGVSPLIMGAIIGHGTADSPIMISTERELQTAISSGDRYFKLENDILLSQNFKSANFAGTIDGNGFKIDAGEYLPDGLIKELSGSVINLSVNIEIKNANIKKNYGIIAINLKGSIEKCKIAGSISGTATLDEDVNIGLFAATNGGVIKNCSSMVDVTLSNGGATNVYYSNIACVNDGTIDSCESGAGKIETDTVDIAGICCVNNGSILNSVNYSQLSQISSKQWHPNVAGVVCTNNGSILNSINHGDLSSESKLEAVPEGSNGIYVFVGGICCNNYNKVSECENEGSVFGKGVVAAVYAGGIAATNECTETVAAQIVKATTKANVHAESSKSTVYASGIAGANFSVVESSFFMTRVISVGMVDDCGYVGEITTNAKTAFVGGVVGYNYYAKVFNSYADLSFVDAYNNADIPNTAAVGGVVGTTNYLAMNDSMIIDNIHYVKKTNISVSVNLLQQSIIYPITDIEAGATAYDNFEDIPQEIRQW